MPANLIGGLLPWGQAAGGANLFQGMGGTPQEAAAALGPNYANAYTSALQMNEANYNNILAGYTQTRQQHADAADAAAGGYTGLTNSVLDRIKGIGAAADARIGDDYAKASGLASQGLITRGLGNTTVANSVQAGIDRDRARARVDLQDTQANRLAGYESSLGQAALGSRQAYDTQGLNLAQNQLGWMNSVNANYPNAGMYGQLAEQFGRMGQANQDRETALKMGGGGPNPASAGIPPTVRGGGQGFFDNPVHGLTGGGGSSLGGFGGMFGGPGSSSYTGGMFNVRPPINGLMGPYDGPIGEMSGGQMSPPGASALGGAAGAFGLADQYDTPYAYQGEGEQAFGGVLGGAAAYGGYVPPGGEDVPYNQYADLGDEFWNGF